MALSNWDIVAWKNGNPHVGKIVFPNDVIAEIYKCDVHVYAITDELHPVMYGINGTMVYKNITIRTKQMESSIFVDILYGSEFNEPSDRIEFVGIGTYGFDGDEYVGVRPKEIEQFKKWLKKTYRKHPIEGCSRYNMGDAFFNEHLFEEDPDAIATKCGEQKDPLLLTAVNIMKNDGGNK